MQNTTIRKTINVDKPNRIPIVNFKQEDDAVLLLSLYRNSIELDLTGQTIKLGVKRANNSIVELTDGFLVDKNNIDITLKNNILAIPGIAECDLEIIDSKGKMTTASFFIAVNKKVLGTNNIEASNDISAINKIVAEVLAKGKELDGNIKVVVEEANKKITAIDTALNKKLNEMQADYNSLQRIIIDENQAANLQDQINKSNEQLEQKAKELDNKKMNKTDILTMANMGQDVKEAMTGGSVAVVAKNTVLTENIVNEQVTPIKLSGVIEGKNKLYKKTCKFNYYYNGENGEIVEGTSSTGLNTITELRRVKGNESYFRNTVSNVVFFDEKYEFISSIQPSVGTFVTPENCFYMGISFKNEDIDLLQIEKGNVKTDYEPYTFELENLGLTDTSISKKDNLVEIFLRDLEVTLESIKKENKTIQVTFNKNAKIYYLYNDRKYGNYTFKTNTTYTLEHNEILILDIKNNNVFKGSMLDVSINYYTSKYVLLLLNIAGELAGGKLKPFFNDIIINNSINQLTNGIVNDKFNIEWEIGSISSSDGVTVAATNRIRSKNYLYTFKGSFIEGYKNVSFAVLKYDKNYNFVSTTGWITGKYEVNEDSIVKILVRYEPSTEITNINNLLEFIDIYIYKYNSCLESKINSIENVKQFWNLDFEFDFEKGYIAGHCFVKDELWIFESSDDDNSHISYAKCKRYSIDFENKTGSLIGTFNHNWGHVNSIDYCEKTNTLIFGNGNGKNTTNIGEIYLVPNAYELKNLQEGSNAPFDTYVQIINVHSHEDWGIKHNVVWGENNNNKFNICYVITNDNSNIRKVLLGQGNNDLGMGILIPGKTDTEFNGTYKVLKEWKQKNGIDVLQGCCYYNGDLLVTLGHDRFCVARFQLNEDSTITRTQYIDKIYDENGEEILGNYLSGIDVKNGKLFIGSSSGTIKCFNL